MIGSYSKFNGQVTFGNNVTIGDNTILYKNVFYTDIPNLGKNISYSFNPIFMLMIV